MLFKNSMSYWLKFLKFVNLRVIILKKVSLYTILSIWFVQYWIYFTSFKWYITPDILNDSPQIAVHMVKDLCDDGNLNHDNLIKFMLSARKLYRNVPYHNFDHAFNFMHCMYNILKRNKTTFSSFEVSTYLSLNFSSLFVNIVWWQIHGGWNFLNPSRPVYT